MIQSSVTEDGVLDRASCLCRGLGEGVGQGQGTRHREEARGCVAGLWPHTNVGVPCLRVAILDSEMKL